MWFATFCKFCYLCTGKRRTINQYQFFVLLVTEITQAPLLGDPHVALTPEFEFIWVCICVQLVQVAFVQRCGLRIVLCSCTMSSDDILARHLGLMRRRLLLILRSAQDVWMRQGLRAAFSLVLVADEEPIYNQINKFGVILLDVFRQWDLLNVAEPIHEEEAGFSVRVSIAQEIPVHGLQEGVQCHQLTDRHANTPNIKCRANSDP
mmetsp:Transcript_51885/g.91147  ORF Transcript_51885/g.91147 Transcript_51885/m.91147 type:complete len:206 (+) Transcript_51885:878-1495(+)